MKKRMTVLLILAALFTCPVPVLAYETPGFSDVPSSHWAYTAIMEMADQKVINGVGNGRFAPDQKVSAAMFLTLTGRIAFPEITVTGSDWSGPYVSAAQNAGWLSGTAIHADQTDADITRYDMAAVLSAAGKQLGLPSAEVETYKIRDYAAIPNGYTKAVEQVYGQGLITGDGEGNFNGSATMSRAEASMVLWRLKALVEKGKNPSASETATPIGGQEIYEKCSPAVFSIDTWDANGDPYASGSGFFIDGSGLAVTNHHVLEDALSASVTLEDGTTHPILGVVEFDDVLDYAVILVEGSGFPTLKVGDSLGAKSGEQVYAIGNPRGLSNTISDGIISNPRRENFDGMIQISVPISHGSSGGALLNTKGEVIGITTASLESGQNLNFAVPIDHLSPVAELLETVRDPGYFTMAEYADYNEHLVYDTVPEKLVDFASYDEMEPNNSSGTATRVYNGEAIEGTIDSNGSMDCFTVHCNTAGTMQVMLFSNADPKYMEDILLCAYKGEDPAVYADFMTTNSGGHYLYLCSVVNEPGVYTVSLLSDSLYKTEHLNTDYKFYFEFTPGDTSGEETTGARPSSKTRRELAFDALASWIQENANSSINGYKEYLERSSDKQDTWSIYYSPDSSRINLYRRREDGGTSFTSFIDLTSDKSEAFISYFYRDSHTHSSDPDLSASATAPMNSFDKNYKLSFYEVEGNDPDIDLHEEMCLYLCLDSLDFADYILRTYLADTGYTIEDFGFTGLNN